MRSMRALAFALVSACATPTSVEPSERACEASTFPEGPVDARAACAFGVGDDTETTLGLTRARVLTLPIEHVIVRVQENRSFDHLFGTLEHRDVDGLPRDASNRDAFGTNVPAFRLGSTCLEADPPHQWNDNVTQWNGGAMNGFVRAAAVDGSDGHYAMGHYTADQLPFYHWVARTFAISDRFFSSTLGGTWSNRNVLYTGAPQGVRNTFDRVASDAPTIFEALTAADVSWAVYLDGPGQPRQDSLGWNRDHVGLRPIEALYADLAAGTLPQVVFVDVTPGHDGDEHPPYDVQRAEAWSRRLYDAVVASPLWPRTAMFWTYDNHGGLYDHVPPPRACTPGPGEEAFTVLGPRIPLLLISPWARRHHVSHAVAHHGSLLRFVELLHDLPAFGGRDANAEPLLDLFAFDCAPDLLLPPEAPAPGVGGC
ncbi:MAG: hypothetical protein H6724_11590 [Sandaracinus sp.]|nr:hypothetical protein [Sandaracinus sp.]MCB9625151.1 hypothetical protein [Sandaracinus sp.]